MSDGYVKFLKREGFVNARAYEDLQNIIHSQEQTNGQEIRKKPVIIRILSIRKESSSGFGLLLGTTKDGKIGHGIVDKGHLPILKNEAMIECYPSLYDAAKDFESVDI